MPSNAIWIVKATKYIKVRFGKLERRFDELQAGIKNGEPGPAGPRGPEGPAGPRGDKPGHEWSGPKLRFEKPDGTWGKWVNLQGPAGRGGGGGSGGSFSPGSLALLQLPVQGTDKVLVERAGAAYRTPVAEVGGGDGGSNIDGGFAASVYLASQSIDGGNA